MPFSPLHTLYMDMRYHLHPLEIPHILLGTPSCSAHRALTPSTRESTANVDTLAYTRQTAMSLEHVLQHTRTQIQACSRGDFRVRWDWKGRVPRTSVVNSSVELARSAIDRSLVGPDKSATVLILSGKGTAQKHKRRRKDD